MCCLQSTIAHENTTLRVYAATKLFTKPSVSIIYLKVCLVFLCCLVDQVTGFLLLTVLHLGYLQDLMIWHLFHDFAQDNFHVHFQHLPVLQIYLNMYSLKQEI